MQSTSKSDDLVESSSSSSKSDVADELVAIKESKSDDVVSIKELSSSVGATEDIASPSVVSQQIHVIHSYST